MPPKVLNRANDRAGSILPVSAAARAPPQKPSTARLKLEVRRLPPSLTSVEFEETLGDEWKLGNGRVDWVEYRQGKVKSSAGKIPELSRCYVHLTSEAWIKEFEAQFLSVLFQDKAGSHKNPDIKHLTPALGFAPNQRTSLNAKQRADNRQGTIDQDSEFIAFLEAETLPIVKPAALDTVGAEKKESERVEVTSTPLIEALREKKANRAKAAAGKEEKHHSKGHVKSDSKTVTQESETPEKGGSTKHKKGEQAAKELSKPVKKSTSSKKPPPSVDTVQEPPAKTVSTGKSKKAARNPKSPTTAASPTPASAAVASPIAASSQSTAPNRAARQRGNTDGIKRMLQKDLGIQPKVTNATTIPPTETPPSTANSLNSSTNTTLNVASQPKNSTILSPTPSKSQLTPKQQAPSISNGSVVKAYLKHANPSQGMTEILIQQALSQYGEVTNVNIDPRKGTASAVFKDAEGLKKAIEAKQVPVANGKIEVLEFRERSGGNSGAGRGGLRGGRGNAKSSKGAGQSTALSPVPAPSNDG